MNRTGAYVPAAPAGTYGQPSPNVLPAWRVNSPQLRRDHGYTDTAVYVSPFRTVAVDQWADDLSYVTVAVYTGTGRSVTNMSTIQALAMADDIIARFRPSPAPQPSTWARLASWFRR